MAQIDLAGETFAQRFLQIGAVDTEIRRAVCRAIGPAESDRMVRDPGARAPVAMNQLRGLRRSDADVVEELQTLQLTRRVGGQCNGRPDLRELGGLLVEARRKAPGAQRVCQDEPADAR